ELRRQHRRQRHAIRRLRLRQDGQGQGRLHLEGGGRPHRDGQELREVRPQQRRQAQPRRIPRRRGAKRCLQDRRQGRGQGDQRQRAQGHRRHARQVEEQVGLGGGPARRNSSSFPRKAAHRRSRGGGNPCCKSKTGPPPARGRLLEVRGATS